MKLKDMLKMDVFSASETFYYHSKGITLICTPSHLATATADGVIQEICTRDEEKSQYPWLVCEKLYGDMEVIRFGVINGKMHFFDELD